MNTFAVTFIVTLSTKDRIPGAPPLLLALLLVAILLILFSAIVLFLPGLLHP